MAPSRYPSTRVNRPLAIASAAILIALAACKSTTPVDDSALTATIQNQLSADSVLAGQPVQTAVLASVVTLSGTVSNDAQRTIAARDAASVPGVREVVNNISLASTPLASAHVLPPPPTRIPLPPPSVASTRRLAQVPIPAPQRQPAPIERHPFDQPSNNQQADNQPTYTPPPPVAPSPPPPPAFKTVTIASGDTLPVRITQTLDSATTQPDTTFSGVVASDILVDGLVAIPAGAAVSGHVDAVQEAAHFKGSALLTVSLVNVTRRGEHIAITTEPYTVSGKGRGVNTAEKTGGGAAVGAILGGIFGGGKGAAIGAAAGGGVGAGSNGITRGQQVQIESESVVRFRLATPITVRVRTDANADNHADPSLERRSPN